MKARKRSPFEGMYGEQRWGNIVLTFFFTFLTLFHVLLAKPIIQTFLRYGFGERYYIRALIILTTCILWLWPLCAEYVANSRIFQVINSFYQTEQIADEQEKIKAEMQAMLDEQAQAEAEAKEKIKAMYDGQAPAQAGNEQDDMQGHNEGNKENEENEEKKVESAFEKRYRAWTLLKWFFPIMAFFHFIFMRRRRNPDHDYSRISTFEGDSWYFVQFLGYHLKKELVFIQQVTTYLFEYTLTKLFYRFIWAKTLLLPPAPFALDVQAYRRRAKEEADHYYFDAIEWGVEPLLFFVCGILLLLMNQSLGGFFVFLSGVYFLAALVEKDRSRTSVLNKIDFYIHQLSLKSFNRWVKTAMKESGVQFRPEQPSDDEILSHLNPHLHKGKERFIVK